VVTYATCCSYINGTAIQPRFLYNGKTKNKTADGLSTKIAQKVVDELDAEVGKESSWMNTFKIN
jgi:hypothetical protein